MKKGKVKADIRGRAMAWLFLLCSLLTCLLVLTTRPNLYASYWERAKGVSPEAVFDAAAGDVPALYEAIPRSLDGDLDALRLSIHTLGGQEQQAFNQHEIDHMGDVAHLFWLAKLVVAACSVGMVVLAYWCFIATRRGKGNLRGIAKGALWGVLDVAVVFAIVAGFAMADFRSAFIFFHKIAFTNDLWLMDPRTDRLIRMLPQPFFEMVVQTIAILWILCILAWCAVWCGVLKRTKANGRREG